MNLLLDTHIALWCISDDPFLSSSARSLILDPENTLFVSAASVWEISLKRSLDRGSLPISGEEALEYFKMSGFRLLAISPEHAARVETLPLHHRDPFDRIIVAQSLLEPLTLMTRDRRLSLYTDSLILV